jgi:hypothetical protein
VRFGQVWLVSDAHAQRIMANGVIPPRKFERPSRWYYRMKEVRKYRFREMTYGTAYVPNFMNFRPVVLQL